MTPILEAGGDRVAVFGLTQRAAGCRSTCTPRPASSTTGGRASAPTTSTAVVDERQRDRLRGASTTAATPTSPRLRTPSRGCCSARWSPSTSAARPTRCPRTRSSCSTRWWPARTRSTPGSTGAPGPRRSFARLVAEGRPPAPRPPPRAALRPRPGPRRPQRRRPRPAAPTRSAAARPGGCGGSTRPRSRRPRCVGRTFLYPALDPDGTVLRDEDLEELTTPDVTQEPAGTHAPAGTPAPTASAPSTGARTE